MVNMSLRSLPFFLHCGIITIRNNITIWGIIMTKKDLILISTLFCANMVVFAAQEKPLSRSLTAAESKVYQVLVAKFQAKDLTANDNTMVNVDILKKQEVFIQSTKKSLWPSWLGIGLATLPYTAKWAIRLMKPTNYSRRLEGWGGWVHEQPSMMRYHAIIDSPLGSFFNVDLERLLKEVQEEFGLPLPMLIYAVAPLIAFYGLYKKYSFLQSQQQELKMVQDMLATLRSFGEPS